MPKHIFNQQDRINQYDIAAMTPADLLALINTLIDDTITNRPMSAEYYLKRLDVIGMLAKLAQEKRTPAFVRLLRVDIASI